MSVTQNPTFSREPEQYEASRHAINQMKYERDSITPEMVKAAIESGDVIDAGRDEGDICVTLRHKWGPMYYKVVLNVDDHTVITVCEKARQPES